MLLLLAAAGHLEAEGLGALIAQLLVEGERLPHDYLIIYLFILSINNIHSNSNSNNIITFAVNERSSYQWVARSRARVMTKTKQKNAKGEKCLVKELEGNSLIPIAALESPKPQNNNDNNDNNNNKIKNKNNKDDLK